MTEENYSMKTDAAYQNLMAWMHEFIDYMSDDWSADDERGDDLQAELIEMLRADDETLALVVGMIGATLTTVADLARA